MSHFPKSARRAPLGFESAITGARRASLPAAFVTADFDTFLQDTENLRAPFGALVSAFQPSSSSEHLFELFRCSLFVFCSRHPSLSFEEQDASAVATFFLATLFSDEAFTPQPTSFARPFPALFATEFPQDRKFLFGIYGLSFPATTERFDEPTKRFEGFRQQLRVACNQDFSFFTHGTDFPGKNALSFEDFERPFAFALFEALREFHGPTSEFSPSRAEATSACFAFLELAGATFQDNFPFPARDTAFQDRFVAFLRQRSSELFGLYGLRLLRTLHPDVCPSSRAAG